MTETEFLTIAGRVLDQIETGIERAADSADVDIECSRSGNVLEIEFIDQSSKIIVNTQAPMQEIWVAARSGGFHFAPQDERWVDTRSGELLQALLARVTLEQSGAAVRFG